MKRNRAWRRSQDKRVIENRMRFLKDSGTSTDRIESFKKKKNKLAVHHPNDCGRTDCGVCHPQKMPGCESKNKDEHVILEKIICKEAKEEVSES